MTEARAIQREKSDCRVAASVPVDWLPDDSFAAHSVAAVLVALVLPELVRELRELFMSKTFRNHSMNTLVCFDPMSVSKVQNEFKVRIDS